MFTITLIEGPRKYPRRALDIAFTAWGYSAVYVTAPPGRPRSKFPPPDNGGGGESSAQPADFIQTELFKKAA